MNQQKMTKEVLTKAMKEFLQDFERGLFVAYEEDEDDIEVSDEEAIRLALEELTDDSVLNYVNENMMIQPEVELEIFGYNIVDSVLEDEKEIGHGIQYISKLFKEPVCLLGKRNETASFFDSTCIMEYSCLFLTINGDWKYANYTEIYEYESDDKSIFYTLGLYKTSNENCYSLDCLEPFLSSNLNEVINGY